MRNRPAQQGDDLAAAAHGLPTGFIHGGSAGQKAAIPGLNLSAAEVDAAEGRMLGLLAGTVAAGGDSCMELQPADAMADVDRSLERSRLRDASAGGAEGLTVAAIQRHQLLRGLAGLLPPQCAAAHGEGVLGRRHVEQLPVRLMTQVGDLGRGILECRPCVAHQHRMSLPNLQNHRP
jgi:hypothetical protein